MGFAALLLLMAFVGWCYLPSPTIRSRETYSALSAYINHQYGDLNDSEHRQRIVVIYQRSDRYSRLRWLSRPASAPRLLRWEQIFSRSTSFEKRFTLQAPYTFTDHASPDTPDLPAAEQELVGTGTLVFSNLSFNHSGTLALFYVEDLCGLCGQGEYVLMKKENGRWEIASEQITWVS